jgi:hypothetical protein
MSSDQELDKVPVTPEPGPDSARWLQALADTGPRRESALAELHAMLVRAARREVARRGPHQQITGPELEDLAYQAAGDALMAITQKIGQFRGESRFTTWAYKFVVLEVSAKIGATSGATRPGRWMPRTGTGCRTGSVSTPRGSRSGGTCSARSAVPWRPSSPLASARFS